MLKLKLNHLFIWAIVLFCLVGCSSSSSSEAEKKKTKDTPTISLKCTPEDVDYNGSVVLEWSSTNAETCEASGSWAGTKETEGRQEISSLTSDVSYTLTCTGKKGKISETVNVTVGEPSSPNTPTVSISANPSSVDMNGKTELSWSSKNVDECKASDGWSGDKATSGTETIEGLTATKTFAISCTGKEGTVEASTTVVVSGSSSSLIVNLSADPTSVNINGNTTLTWSSENAEKCTASGAWQGPKDTSGSETIESLQTTSTYTLRCENGSGDSEDVSVTVTVGSENTGTATLSWIPPTTNEDQTPLTDLAGYNVYYGNESRTYNHKIPVALDDEGLTDAAEGRVEYTVTNLPAGKWFFAVSAYNTSDIESDKSNEADKEIVLP